MSLASLVFMVLLLVFLFFGNREILRVIKGDKEPGLVVLGTSVIDMLLILILIIKLFMWMDTIKLW